LIEDAAQALHTTAAMRFGRSTALSQIAFATLRQLCIAANVSAHITRRVFSSNSIVKIGFIWI